MVLVDTSIWIKHLGKGLPKLVDLLTSGQVLMHSMVIGELACGSLKNRDEILELLKNLPRSQHASDNEVLHLIETRKLMSLGIGYIDMHLLAATLLGGDQIWTADTKLAGAASALKIGYSI